MTIEWEVIKEFKDMQLGDIKATHADSSNLKDWVGELPETSLETGIKSLKLK